MQRAMRQPGRAVDHGIAVGRGAGQIIEHLRDRAILPIALGAVGLREFRRPGNATLQHGVYLPDGRVSARDPVPDYIQIH